MPISTEIMVNDVEDNEEESQGGGGGGGVDPVERLHIDAFLVMGERVFSVVGGLEY